MTAPSHSDLIGEFTYLSTCTDSSLRRNGKVYTRRDGDGSDNEWVGVNFDKWSLPVGSARDHTDEKRHKLDPNGFELRPSEIDHLGVDFMNNRSVVSAYYPHCAKLVKEASGADHVVAFDHNVRSVSGSRKKERIDGGQHVQPPLHIVHGDYTLTSAPRRLRDLTGPPSNNDTYRETIAEGTSLLSADAVERAISNGRFAIINVWRSIAAEPVATHPLALCDAALVSPKDLVVFEIHYADRVGENYYAKYSDAHEWFFYPQMTRDEALLIKQWDSGGELASSEGVRADSAVACGLSTFSFHSAFEDTSAPPDAPSRRSIEVRCVALF